MINIILILYTSILFSVWQTKPEFYFSMKHPGTI